MPAGVGRGGVDSAASALVALDEVVVGSGGAATIDFQNIAQTYRHLLIELNGRGDGAFENRSVGVRFNNDATSVYDWMSVAGNATTASAGGGAGQASITAGYVPGSTATAGRSGALSIRIPNYRGTTFQKAITSVNSYFHGTSVGGFTARTHGGLWRSTAAITRVTLIIQSDNFAEGTVATLYGLNPT